jgi:hypothetical protein
METEMQEELRVMGVISELLEPLDQAARQRVINWVMATLAISGPTAPVVRANADTMLRGPNGHSEPTSATFAEFFHEASPRSEKEKALVAAHWIQRSSGVDQFNAQQVNSELKNIGYRVANITDALSQLMSERPNLVIQLTKSGSSKQARKTYKVTDAGSRRVTEMLDSIPGGTDEH